MKISQLFESGKKPTVSLEIFPPKPQYPIESIYSTIEEIQTLNPDYISVTYSAGGTGNCLRTAEIASYIKKKYGIETVAHLTCINSTEESISKRLEDWKANDISNILALRGDIPEGFDMNAPQHYSYASDLIPIIKKAGFCAGAAAYVEGHIECESLEKSLEHLKIKQDAGAEFFVTQLFFDNVYFYDFAEKAAKAGINRPIIAGIMPMLSRSQIERMVFTSGVSLPSRIVRLLNKYKDSPEDLKKAGIEYAAEQLNGLIKFGASGVHIYTMNKPDVAKGCVERLESVPARHAAV